MSRYNDDSEDLTTDALPSPPRDEPKESEDSSEKDYINAEPETKSKPNFFSRKKKKSPTAFASVINISNANGIHIGSNYNIHINKIDNEQQKEVDITDAIQALFDSTISVVRKHLTFISQHMNQQWRTTARELKYSDGQISQFHEDYIRCGIKEVIFQLLLDWIQNEPDVATVGKLSKVLWETNQQDAVKRWSKNFVTE